MVGDKLGRSVVVEVVDKRLQKNWIGHLRGFVKVGGAPLSRHVPVGDVVLKENEDVVRWVRDALTSELIGSNYVVLESLSPVDGSELYLRSVVRDVRLDENAWTSEFMASVRIEIELARGDSLLVRENYWGHGREPLPLGYNHVWVFSSGNPERERALETALQDALREILLAISEVH